MINSESSSTVASLLTIYYYFVTFFCAYIILNTVCSQGLKNQSQKMIRKHYPDDLLSCTIGDIISRKIVSLRLLHILRA